MTAPAWLFAAVAAVLGGGWGAEAGMRCGQVRRLQADLREAEATIDRFMEAVDTLAAQVRCGVNIDLDAEAPFAMCVLAENMAAALEAERDAHQAIGVELCRVEGEISALHVMREHLAWATDGWRNACVRLEDKLARANEALEAERDAHRATGAELRRVEGECAALRDQCVRRGPGGRFVSAKEAL